MSHEYRVRHDETVYLLFKGQPGDALCVEHKGKDHIAIWLDACHAATKAEELEGEMLAVKFGVLLQQKSEADFCVVGSDGHIYGPSND